MPNKPDLAGLIERVDGLHEKIANDIPRLRRGMVWCRTCQRSERVDGALCLRHGWPKCCGFTMTIDSPEEQDILRSMQEERTPEADR